MRRTIGLSGTLLVHIALVLALLGVTARVPAPLGTIPEAITPSAPEHLREIAERTIQVDGDADGEGRRAADEQCERHSYIGAGIIVGTFDDRIIDVGAHTPAARAGLRKGDVLRNKKAFDGAKEGTIVRLVIYRDGALIMVPVRIGKICEG